MIIKMPRHIYIVAAYVCMFSVFVAEAGDIVPLKKPALFPSVNTYCYLPGYLQNPPTASDYSLLQWWVSHFDVLIGGDPRSVVHAASSNTIEFVYGVATVFTEYNIDKDSCRYTMDTLKRWVGLHYADYGFSSAAAAFEDCFMHAKQEVTIKFSMGDSMDVPAYNAGNPRLSRLPSTWQKNSDWCMNIKSPVYRAFWFTYWEPVGAIGYDGYMLDVYSYPNEQVATVKTIEFANDSDYNVNLVSFTQGLRSTMTSIVPPKYLGINSYKYSTNAGYQNTRRDTFQFVNYFDFELREMGVNYYSGWLDVIMHGVNATYNACNQGKMILFQHDQEMDHTVDKSLNDSLAKMRDQMAGLCAYFIAKNGPTYFFTYPGQNYIQDKRKTSWFPAMACNIGQPTNQYFTWDSGVDPSHTSYGYIVLGRNYDSALVLFKPKYVWSTTVFDSTSATTKNLGKTYRRLQADGTLGSPINSISLKNWDGAILIPQNGVNAIRPNPFASAEFKAYPIRGVGKGPVVRISIGNIDLLEIFIYGVTGKLVDKSLPIPKPGGVNYKRESFYDYSWEKANAPGIYIAEIRAKTGGGKELITQCRFAVLK